MSSFCSLEPHKFLFWEALIKVTGIAWFYIVPEAIVGLVRYSNLEFVRLHVHSNILNSLSHTAYACGASAKNQYSGML
jgi:hypothetical protein